MKSNMRGIVRGGILWVMSLAFVSIVVTACSDDDSGFAGGSTEDFEGGELDTGEPDETPEGSISTRSG